MGFSLTQAARQTGILNQSLVQSFNILRMNRAELAEYLSNALEENPFLEADQQHPDLPNNLSGHNVRPTQEPCNDIQTGLYRHVTEQLPFVLRNGDEARIAQAFLMELEPSGWLGLTVEEIAERYGFTLDECLSVLARLQTLEPAGLFARGLKDCLRLQALDRGQMDDVMDALISRLDEFLDCDIETLANRLKVDPAEIARRLFLIRRMNPKPGSGFEFDATLLRQSDVNLRVDHQDLVIELNKSSFPTVRLPEAMHTDDILVRHQKHLGKMIRDAKSLKNALEYRNSTTLAVVASIFARQRGFLAHGYSALRPMGMTEIAADVGVSEATVSRVVSGLTVQCPQGNILAKSLFCEPVSYCKQPTTRHLAVEMIKRLIAAEDKLSPLNDGEIASKMQRQGLSISRRTVAKYRNHLGVSPPVVRRKNAELAALSGWQEHLSPLSPVKRKPTPVGEIEDRKPKGRLEFIHNLSTDPELRSKT